MVEPALSEISFISSSAYLQEIDPHFIEALCSDNPEHGQVSSAALRLKGRVLRPPQSRSMPDANKLSTL
jgi:hypothetical protein